MSNIKKPIIIRTEKEERYTVNTAYPIEGTPILSVQGKDITTTTITVAGEIPDMEGCSSLGIYGEDFSGKTNSNSAEIKYAGTPYTTTVITCMGE